MLLLFFDKCFIVFCLLDLLLLFFLFWGYLIKDVRYFLYKRIWFKYVGISFCFLSSFK